MAEVSESFWRELIDDDYKVKIIDIGAAEGEGYSPSYQKLLDLGLASIVGFEPNKESCASLNQKKEDGSIYLPYFIGDGEIGTFYETNWPPTGSLYKPNTELLEKFNNLNEVTILKKEHQVQTHRLDDIPEIKKADFLKMDIQGAEPKVLKGAKERLGNFDIILTELNFYDLYKKQVSFYDIEQYLKPAGFKLFDISHISKNPINGRTDWVDVIYTK